MKKINEFYGIIFKRVTPELSGVCCFLECILEGIFFYLMSHGILLTRDAPPIEPTAAYAARCLMGSCERSICVYIRDLEN